MKKNQKYVVSTKSIVSKYKKLTLPREIIISKEIAPRFLINLSRTCKHLHKLLTPVKIQHNYLNSQQIEKSDIKLITSLDNIIYLSRKYTIVCKDNKYDVHTLERGFHFPPHEGPINFDLITSDYKSISILSYNHPQEIEPFFIVDHLLDGVQIFDPEDNDEIISTSNYRIRLPYNKHYSRKSDLSYSSNFDGYYRILIGNEMYLKIAYEAAIRGKQVDILKNNLSEKMLECIASNNYVNNLDNIRVIDSVENMNYDAVMGVEEDNMFIDSLYTPDIYSSSRDIVNMSNKYPNRVLIVNKDILFASYLIITSHNKFNFGAKSGLPWTPNLVDWFRNVFGDFVNVCPLCISMEQNNIQLLEEMYNCCVNHGELWNDQAARLKNKIAALSSTI